MSVFTYPRESSVSKKLMPKPVSVPSIRNAKHIALIYPPTSNHRTVLFDTEDWLPFQGIVK